jgi:HAMP domain-containing protein
MTLIEDLRQMVQLGMPQIERDARIALAKLLQDAADAIEEACAAAHAAGLRARNAEDRVEELEAEISEMRARESLENT